MSLDQKEINELYAGYDNLPYISPDRDIQLWIKELKIGKSKLVPKRNMTYLEDCILPGHIILLWRIQFGTYTSETWSCKYFEYTYGIDEAKALEELIQNGFVREESVFESLKHVLGSYLKAFLKSYSIKGLSKLKKEELIDKVKEVIPEDELIGLVEIRGYTLTKEGKSLLERHSDVVEKHPKKKL